MWSHRYQTTQRKQTRQWDLSKVAPGGELLESFDGFWFEDAKNRLWVTSTIDYTVHEQVCAAQ